MVGTPPPVVVGCHVKTETSSIVLTMRRLMGGRVLTTRRLMGGRVTPTVVDCFEAESKVSYYFRYRSVQLAVFYFFER